MNTGPVKSFHDVIGEVLPRGNEMVLRVLLAALGDAVGKGQTRRVRVLRAKIKVVEDRIKQARKLS